MGKFDSVLAEAAYTIMLHGFTEDQFGTSDSGGWNGLVDVSATGLLNLGEDELRERFVAKHGDAAGGYLVWIREDSQGFVTLVEYGDDAGTRSGTDAVARAFDAASEDYDQEEV